MFILKPKREREGIIISEMICMYCLNNHSTQALICNDCSELNDYALKRLKSCLFRETKPVCKNCPVHCYSPKHREQMRKVMQYSGPRMLLHKPFYAIIHMVDNLTASKPNRSVNKANDKDHIK